VVENKITNASSLKKKMEAWESITSSFNSVAESPRTVKQLKTLYENIKRKARKDVAEEHVSMTLLLRYTNHIIIIIYYHYRSTYIGNVHQ
jgi:Myb/SANT-like DNA-binding domain